MIAKFTPYVILVAGLIAFCAVPRSAMADEIVDVSVNTLSLEGMTNSEVFFELTNSSGLENVLTISDISLGGGSPGAVDTNPLDTAGGVDPSSNLSSAISINDSDYFFNEFAQFFTPGEILSFTLDLTTNFISGGTPDEFSLYIDDPNENCIDIATDPTCVNSILSVSLDSTTAPTTTYDSDFVTITPVATPEPSSLWLLVSGLALLGLAQWKLVRRKTAEC